VRVRQASLTIGKPSPLHKSAEKNNLRFRADVVSMAGVVS
jgi:hypothetical protein